MAGGAGLLALLLALPAAPAASAGAGSPPAVPQALPGAPPFSPELRVRLERALAALGEDYEPRTRQRADDGAPLYTNRLLLETSPYLRQHAHNPVDWFPWGDEPFAEARRSGRPVLVSIGYSTCHWCHVMEEESFDDPQIAELINRHFVAIKVDREARPDVDAVYMSAIQAMTGGGGWPLNVWVTPDRKPFYAGTYYPPYDRDGRRGLATVLRVVAERWQADRGSLAALSERLTTTIRSQLESGLPAAVELPGVDVLKRARDGAVARIDREWGGIGSRMKFPSGTPIRLLLREHARTGDGEALSLAVLTLEKMAAGGIRDQLGGGFHRYATDRRWLIPHFEKMLYDNAQLAVAYLEAWQATGREDFAAVVRQTLDYLLTEMRAPGGGFYSATDADSRAPGGELEEGRFFTWTPAEIEAVLEPVDARAFQAYYGVTSGGDVEGRSVLRTWRALDEVAAGLSLEPEELEVRLARGRGGLQRARSERPAPFRDEKILTAWNGLAISALARAGFAFDEPRYRSAAAQAARFALDEMRQDGVLLRVHQNGRSSGPAFLEDYAFLVAGLLDLYEALPDPAWLREARALQAVLDARYADERGGYFQVAGDQEILLVREKPVRDGAVPSGNSVAALNLLRLAEFSGDSGLRERADRLLLAFAEPVERDPLLSSELLLAVDYRLDAVKEIVVVRPEKGALTPLLAPLRSSLVPNRILAVVTEGPDAMAHAEQVPLVAGKPARRGRTTAYVCENRVCSFPTSDPAVFADQIRRRRPAPTE